MLASMFSWLFAPWHGAVTEAQPAHVNPTLDSCTSCISLLGGQTHCRMRSLPKAPTLDQCRVSNPKPLDLWSSALPTGPRDPTLKKVLNSPVSVAWNATLEWLLHTIYMYTMYFTTFCFTFTSRHLYVYALHVKRTLPFSLLVYILYFCQKAAVGSFHDRTCHFALCMNIGSEFSVSVLQARISIRLTCCIMHYVCLRDNIV